MLKIETQIKLDEFIMDRDWHDFHTEESLAKSLSIEANELLRHYQWGDDWPNKLPEENKKEEIADIIIYTIYYCKQLGFDIDKIVNEKIDKNEVKYPCKRKFSQIFIY